MDKKGKLYTVQESAKFLSVNPGTIRRWAHNKQLHGIKVGIRGDWRFSQAELLKMAKTNLDQSNPQSSQSPLEDKELFFKNVANAVPALVAVYSIRTGEYIYVNNAVKRILGYIPEDFINGGFSFASSLVHPDDMPRIMKENELALAVANSKNHAPDNEPIVDFEYRMKHKNGSWRWLHTYGRVYARGKDGKVEYILNASVGITQRKEMEEELKKNAAEKTKYEKTLIDHIADAVIVTDKNYNVTAWNKGAERIYGWNAEEVMGKYTPQIFKSEFVDSGSNERWEEALEKRGSWEGEVLQLRKDGSRVPMLASVSYVKNDNGEIIGAFAVNRDISRRKEIEKRKDDFIALVSHELKTPVTSLKIFTQVLEKRFMNLGDIELVKYFGKMDRQLTKLSDLVTRLLDITRIQEGKMMYKKEPFILNDLIDETIENVQRVTDSHVLMFNRREGGWVIGDRDRIEQVLINLLTNAVKYSLDADKVIVDAVVDGNYARVSVKDFGTGIAKEQQKGIFDRFYQVNNRANTYPGLGVGLYISKEIIDRHDGKLWVESPARNASQSDAGGEEGKGSTFFFTLPLKK